MDRDVSPASYEMGSCSLVPEPRFAVESRLMR